MDDPLREDDAAADLEAEDAGVARLDDPRVVDAELVEASVGRRLVHADRTGDPAAARVAAGATVIARERLPVRDWRTPPWSFWPLM
jgi:hypothetical protein